MIGTDLISMINIDYNYLFATYLFVFDIHMCSDAALRISAQSGSSPSPKTNDSFAGDIHM